MTVAQVALLPTYGGRPIPNPVTWEVPVVFRVEYCFGRCHKCGETLDGVEAVAVRERWESLCHTENVYHPACAVAPATPAAA